MLRSRTLLIVVSFALFLSVLGNRSGESMPPALAANE
jgi:hypothetical protein